MELPVLTYLRITGNISIKPVTGRIPHHVHSNSVSFFYLIMGPTGAGKSSFIEALAGESQQLSISKNQLAGYTQTVNAYHLVNATVENDTVYLIDTPGFSDSKISEIEIMDMVRKWVKDNDCKYIDRIFYLTPISETRLPGSRRKTINMLKQFLAPTKDGGSVTFVTTMWDTLHNERTRTRAESNFAQLRHEVCEDFFGRDQVSITRFKNTKNSALEVLDARGPEETRTFSRPSSSASPNLYQDLHMRIEGALQAKQMIESELAQPEAQTNAELRAILKRNQRENHRTLTKFIQQFINFHPLPAEFRLAAQHLRKSISAKARPASIKSEILFWKWAQEPPISNDDDLHGWAETSQPLSFKDIRHFTLDAVKRHSSKVFTSGA